MELSRLKAEIGRLDRTVFWKLGYWLARKYRRGFRSLMRDHVRAPEPGQTKTWVLQGQNSRGWYGAVALRCLVTSRKGRFTWRSPSENPYIMRDETRGTIEVALCRYRLCYEQRLNGEPDALRGACPVRGGETGR